MKAKKTLIRNMAIVDEKRQVRVAIPESMRDLFNITPADTFNWYLERKDGKIRLIGMLVKKNYRLDYWEKRNNEKNPKS